MLLKISLPFGTFLILPLSFHSFFTAFLLIYSHLYLAKTAEPARLDLLRRTVALAFHVCRADAAAAAYLSLLIILNPANVAATLNYGVERIIRVRPVLFGVTTIRLV